MSYSAQQQIMMVLSIIGRGKGKHYRATLDAQGISLHLQMVGLGTAPSEMMDIFGLGTNDKDILISLAPRVLVEPLAAGLAKSMDTTPRYGGLMMMIPLNAINRLSAEILTRSTPDVPDKNKKEVPAMNNNEYKYQMILISVNQGYTDQVMQTAKKAGATGGTILRARLAGEEKLQQFDETETAPNEEKEIILILATETDATRIMNEVNHEHGLKTDAKGMIWAVPVERALKI